MVSTKKRPAVDVTDIDQLPLKKSKTEGTAGSSKQVSSKKSKNLGKIDSSLTAQHEEVHVPTNDDIPDWPEVDLVDLMKRIEANIPQKDNLRYDSRAEKLNWEEISFGNYSATECKEMWMRIQKRVRRFRLLKEVLEDAKLWVSKPWTNFYHSQKLNRHPNLPKRPLSTYMIFYMEKKDKVSKENPGMNMTAVSKCISEMYKNLPDKKKQKYVAMAAAQRKEYEEKMKLFNQAHPELASKVSKSKEPKQQMEIGPRKPMTPFKLFLADKMNSHKNDSDFDRHAFTEKYKKQWRDMSDKKKVIWINWAMEEESKYQEELKDYMTENPDFAPAPVKTVLTKEEKNLVERVAGKPEKPPNSGYSLFSRIMLMSAEMKHIASKERMAEISRLWKSFSKDEKNSYQEQVNHMLDQYKLEYATYLESLPEDKRQEELLSNHPKRKVKVDKESKPKPTKKKKEVKDVQAQQPSDLFEGEPEPPPVNALQLFMKTFTSEAKNASRESEARRSWQMLPDSEKIRYRKKLHEIKQRYIEDYEKFLKSLTQEQLKEYSLQKNRKALGGSEGSDSDSATSQQESDSEHSLSDSDSDSDSSDSESSKNNSSSSKSSDSE
uniref:HMG box domain-containing protein n=1 Tax=Timema genevievae TaxID=629358 RepID=A0A7R9PP56_TIMGE|nr:unnamed protein product [Timema genevievae]